MLDYFISQDSNEKLKLKELSAKLVTLLALTTGHRIQTISLIDLNNIRISKSKIEIKITAPIKTTI